MIRATRRAVVLGVLALPAASRASGFMLGARSGAVLLHDPGLEEGRRFAEAGRSAGAKVLPIEGDRIRFAREVFGAKPVYVAGVSRQADFVLIEDVAREFGYRREARSAAGAVIEWRLVPFFSR